MPGLDVVLYALIVLVSVAGAVCASNSLRERRVRRLISRYVGGSHGKGQV